MYEYTALGSTKLNVLNTSDFGMTQNGDEGNDQITLGYDEEFINGQRFKAPYESYLEKESLSAGIFSQNNFEELWKNDKEIREKYKNELSKKLYPDGWNFEEEYMF